MMDAYTILTLVGMTAIPYLELRFSIPVGIIEMGLNPMSVFMLCTIVNILIILPIFLFLDHLLPFIRHWKIVDRTINKIQQKTHKYVEKYGAIGLLIYVAIPLPGSGVYAGSLAAYIFGVPKKHSFPAIAGGAIIAGVLVTLASTGILALF